MKWLISSKIKIKIYFPFLATKCIKLGFKKGIKNAENCRFEMGIAGHISIHTLNAGSSTTYVWLKVGFASLPGIDFHRAFGSNKAFWHCITSISSKSGCNRLLWLFKMSGCSICVLFDKAFNLTNAL